MTGRELVGAVVVVTRAEVQAASLVERLRSLGAEVVEAPVIEVVPPSDGGVALRQAVDRMADYDWLVLTSANTVAALTSCAVHGLAQLGVIGSATADFAGSAGLEPAFVPSSFGAEAFVEEFPPGPGRVLLPQAADARPTLAEGLRAKGWRVDTVEAYDKRSVRPPDEILRHAEASDAIVFTSPSTVINYLAVARAPSIVICIGPTTAKTAEENGLAPYIADPHTVDGIVDVLIREVRR